jgi:threonine dehydratase
VAGDKNWPVIKSLVDGVILVSEDEIEAAMRHIWERMKLVSGSVDEGGARVIALTMD